MEKSYGITAFVLGIISIPVSLLAGGFIIYRFLTDTYIIIIAVIGWIVPILAIGFGLTGAVVCDSKGKAISGIILGIIGITLRILIQFIPFLPFLGS